MFLINYLKETDVYRVDCVNDLLSWFLISIIFILTSRKIGNRQKIETQNSGVAFTSIAKMETIADFDAATRVWTKLIIDRRKVLFCFGSLILTVSRKLQRRCSSKGQFMRQPISVWSTEKHAKRIRQRLSFCFVTTHFSPQLPAEL